MVVFRKKKSVKFRGHKTHGWGSKKKHRGAGNRGGRGNAGTGKRADQNKPTIWKEKYFGKSGFKKHGQKEEIMPINISYFDENFDKLVAKGLLVKEKEGHAIDTAKIGYNKVLGTGNIGKKLIITSKYFSESAVKKIEAAGGKVIKTEAGKGQE